MSGTARFSATTAPRCKKLEGRVRPHSEPQTDKCPDKVRCENGANTLAQAGSAQPQLFTT